MEQTKKRFPTSTNSYTIEIANPSALADVLQIMRDNFYYEEVMFQALCSTIDMTEDEKKVTTEILDETIKAAFNAAPCLVAVDSVSKRIIGVNLMTVSENPKFDGTVTDGLSAIFASNKGKSKLVDSYLYYLSDINDKANLFATNPQAAKMLEFYAIAIDKNHRRIGVAGSLINAGIELAHEMENIFLVFGVFTSKHSTRSAEKVGMNTILEIDLLDYKNKEGETIFLSTKPHNIVSVMVSH